MVSARLAVILASMLGAVVLYFSLPADAPERIEVSADGGSSSVGESPATGDPDGSTGVHASTTELLSTEAVDWEKQDAAHRDLLVGRWEQENLGKRTLDVKPDGSATMTFEPGGLLAFTLGDRLVFDAEWTLERGRLDIHVTGGTPKTKAKIALGLVGDHWNRPIEKLNQEYLAVRKEEDNSLSEWSRLE